MSNLEHPPLPAKSTIEIAINWVYENFKPANLYYGHGSDNPWDEAVFLVMSALDMPLQGDTEQLDQTIPENKASQIERWTRQRISTRKPLPYITGTAYFCGLKFSVTEDVLIPRSPIAEMVVNRFKPWLDDEPSTILDLCTGGGCIAIACAYAFPEANIDAADISEAALAVANNNILAHDLGDRLRLFQGDLFQSIPKHQHKYDLIISNPPYVDDEDMADLPEEFKQEPELALAAGKDGLDLVRIMLAKASQHLNEKGIIVIEVGNSAKALEDAFPKVGFTWIEFEQGGEGVFVLDKSQLLEHFSA